MTQEIQTQLLEWAEAYETPAFIQQDPIQFPHRFSHKADIEISGLLTAWISFGNRKMICRKANELHEIMRQHPLEYVLSRAWENDFPPTDQKSFYRTCPKSQMHYLFTQLYDVYSHHEYLEDRLCSAYSGSPRERLCQWLQVSAKSPQKKLNMFLRWMIRRHSDVDFGIWNHFASSELIIPLDTHVCRMAHELQLIEKQSYSLNQAIRITQELDKVFPNDPCKGDFALFGYGIEHKDNHKGSTSK